MPSPCSEGFRWRLNRGSGMAGWLSARNMLAGAGMITALVTGPVGEMRWIKISVLYENCSSLVKVCVDLNPGRKTNWFNTNQKQIILYILDKILLYQLFLHWMTCIYIYIDIYMKSSFPKRDKHQIKKKWVRHAILLCTEPIHCSINVSCQIAIFPCFLAVSWPHKEAL